MDTHTFEWIYTHGYTITDLCNVLSATWRYGESAVFFQFMLSADHVDSLYVSSCMSLVSARVSSFFVYLFLLFSVLNIFVLLRFLSSLLETPELLDLSKCVSVRYVFSCHPVLHVNFHFSKLLWFCLPSSGRLKGSFCHTRRVQ